MKYLLIIFSLLLTSQSWSKDFDYDDLVERDGLIYEKFSNEPFTGTISGKIQRNYKEGRKEMKPDVIQQTKELREERIKAQQKRMENSGTGVKVKLENGNTKELSTLEIINMLEAHKKEIVRLNAIIDNLKNINSIEN